MERKSNRNDAKGKLMAESVMKSAMNNSNGKFKKQKSMINTNIRVSTRLSKMAGKGKDLADTSIQGTKILLGAHKLFDQLTRRDYLNTGLEIISMVVSYDSKFVIGIC